MLPKVSTAPKRLVVSRSRPRASYRTRSRRENELWQEGNLMSSIDKAKNAAQEAKGKVKETAGKASDNERLEAEGQADQAGANLKQAGEKVKDAFKG